MPFESPIPAGHSMYFTPPRERISVLSHAQVTSVCSTVMAALVGVAVGAMLQPGHAVQPPVPAASVVTAPAAAPTTLVVQLPAMGAQPMRDPAPVQRLVAPVPVKAGAVSTAKQVAPTAPKITIQAPAPVTTTTTVTSTPRSAPSDLPSSNDELTDLPSSNGTADSGDLSDPPSEKKAEVKSESKKHHKKD